MKADFIYDASNLYTIDLRLMNKYEYEEELEPGNVIVMDCGLEKYSKTGDPTMIKLHSRFQESALSVRAFHPSMKSLP